jgi:hypothetical protein
MLLAMTRVPYLVSVVVDREYGSRLRGLLEAGPVWVVDSPVNRDSAENLWTEFRSLNHLEGVTIFKAENDISPAQMLIDEMPTIDLHHRDYSADPPYTVIRVVGCEPNPEVRETLEEFGFDSFNRTPEGFEAMRPLPPPRED